MDETHNQKFANAFASILADDPADEPAKKKPKKASSDAVCYESEKNLRATSSTQLCVIILTLSMLFSMHA